MDNEIPKYIDSIAKRVYPLTEKEKNCVNEFGKMVINRGHLKKAIIETISKYDSKDAKDILESAGTEETKDSPEVHY